MTVLMTSCNRVCAEFHIGRIKLEDGNVKEDVKIASK